MHPKAKSFAASFKDDDASKGAFEAVFSTFGIVDADGEVVAKSALEPHHGKEIPIVWGHDWHGPAIGKGTIEVDDDRARIRGQFNLGSTAGKDAYETVRFMGGLQEYSWGFGVTDIGATEVDGDTYPEIRGVEPIEVSPVLVGSNPQTGTLDIKDGVCPTCGARKGASNDEQDDDDDAERDRLIAARKQYELAQVEIADLGL